MRARILSLPAACALALASTAASGADKCEATIGSNDAMRFDTASITVPSSCRDFTIRLRHDGKLPVAAMGHSVVVSSSGDMAAVLADGAAAGAAHDYVKPGDPRVVAHTRLIGGGGSTSTSFPVAKLRSGGPWVFFCSFPGHSALMKGTLSVP